MDNKTNNKLLKEGLLLMRMVFVMVLCLFFFRSKPYIQDIIHEIQDASLNKKSFSDLVVYKDGTPKPTKTGYYMGEEITMTTNVVRYYDGEMEWEDAPYCKYGDGDNILHKQFTQYWPPNLGYREKALIGEYESNWAYTLPISEHATECMMCGVATIWVQGNTREYEKSQRYCTDFFKVNL